MKRRLTRIAPFAAAVALLLVLTIVCAPLLSRWMKAYAEGTAAPPGPAANADETGMTIPYLAALESADKFGFYGSKSVIGQDGTYVMQFTCAVKGDDYVLQTEQDDHTYRQLYVDGQYRFVDDTDKTILMNILRYEFPDTHFKEAIQGKIIRRSEEIIDGAQAECVLIYWNGTVYAYYLNQQGDLIRFYYIYDGNEVTLDFVQMVVGQSCCASFDVPSTYTVY